jgi:hypothetical protein
MRLARLFALIIFTGVLSLPALIVSQREAKASWCAYVGDGTNKCYPTLRQCRRAVPTRNCVRGAS